LKLKRVLWVTYGAFAFLVGIVLTGFIANFSWYLFHAVILGWRDSGPDWYINIQDWVMYGIFAGSAALWGIVGYCRYARNKKG
jgi:hypothetical protein